MEGGIAIFDFNICRQLSDKGHKVIVLANNFKRDDSFDSRQSFNIMRLNCNIRPTSIEIIYKILFFAVSEKIDVIFFGHFGSTHWLGGVLAKRIFKIPYVILVHGTEFNAYFHRFTLFDHWASKIVFKSANALIVNSRATKELVENYSFPSSQIYIVNPGTDSAKFKLDGVNEAIKKKYQLEGKKVLLTASRLVPKKNHENVLKALTFVVKEIPNLIYLILGDGQEKDKLIKLTQDLRLENYVKFLGYIEPEDMPMYYNVCDVFVMTSKTVDIDYESFGIVFLEANACEKPVIGGKSGGITDAVIDGITGLLVNPENIHEISQAIIRLLTDSEYAQRLGKNGRKYVQEKMDWNRVGNNIETVLNQL